MQSLAIGPQLRGESRAAKRLRFHQSWYRAHVLRVGYGRLTGPRGRELGSVLTADDGKRGLNFVTVAAHKLYLDRRDAGWGVEPDRCERYLTSSQALAINLMGPLLESTDWLGRVMQSLTGSLGTYEIERAEIEFAPARPSEYLGDKTRVDVFMVLRQGAHRRVVVVEIKYSDRFNSRNVNVVDNPRYAELNRVTAIWRDDWRCHLNQEASQLFRCHALAAAHQSPLESWVSAPLLMVWHHPCDSRARPAVERYANLLRDRASTMAVGLDRILEVMRTEAGDGRQRAVVDRLTVRYLAHELSEPSWRRHIAP